MPCIKSVIALFSSLSVTETIFPVFLVFFGTSVRRSSQSAFGRSTDNDVSGHYKRHYFFFFLFFFSFLFFSPSSTFLKEGVLGSKNLFSES